MRGKASQNLEIVVSGPRDKRLRDFFERELKKQHIGEIRTKKIQQGPNRLADQNCPVDLFVVLCPRKKSALINVAECLKSLSQRSRRNWATKIWEKIKGSERRHSMKRVGIWLSTSGGHSVPVKLKSSDVANAILKSENTRVSVPTVSVREKEWAKMSVAACCGSKGIGEFDKKMDKGTPTMKAVLEIMEGSNPSENAEKAKFAF